MRHNDLVTFIVILVDIFFLNLLFASFGYGHFHATRTDMIQAHIVISAIYFGLAMNTGVVLHQRSVRRYQVAAKVVRNILFFFIVTTPSLLYGRFVHPTAGAYLFFLLVAVVVIAFWRLSMRELVIRYRMSAKQVRKVVLVGMSRSNLRLYHELVNNSWPGYKVCGYFDDAVCKDVSPDCLYLGKMDDVLPYLQEHADVCRLYYEMTASDEQTAEHIMQYCENHLVHFYSVLNTSNFLAHRMHIRYIGDVPYVGLHAEPLSYTSSRMQKRLFDILFSLTFICTLFPFILIIVSLVTKITMPGPVFFRQKRTGYNGKEFYCLKFRSMRVNAESDCLQATKDDPRKTKWGNIMRKTNIDELPQFINVLMGDMSVVGPRPHMVKHTEEYSQLIDKYMVRHWVKPGITGWSQVTGYRGETRQLSEMEGRIRGDIYYIEHWSFGLDLYIICKTIVNAFCGDKKAY